MRGLVSVQPSCLHHPKTSADYRNKIPAASISVLVVQDRRSVAASVRAVRFAGGGVRKRLLLHPAGVMVKFAHVAPVAPRPALAMS